MDGVVSLTLPGCELPYFADQPQPLLQALAATWEIPREDREPLVLWGPPESGKSMLIAGLLRAWHQKNPGQKSRLLTAVDFARAYADAVDTDTITSFRTSLATPGCVVLEQAEWLLDKPAAARELSSLLDHAQLQGQKVAITSRIPPAQFLPTSLASRLCAGLVIALETPNESVLRAIFRHTCPLPICQIDPDFADYLFDRWLALHKKELTPRFLAGLWKQLELAAQATHAPITRELVDETFPLVVTRADVPLSQIWLVVSRRFRVRPAELRSSSRRQTLVLARGVAAWLARKLTGASLQSIGRELGNRDHSTISHLLEKTTIQLQDDLPLANQVAAIEAELCSLSDPRPRTVRRRGKRDAPLSPRVGKGSLGHSPFPALSPNRENQTQGNIS